jgi:hypothetical protein
MPALNRRRYLEYREECPRIYYDCLFDVPVGTIAKRIGVTDDDPGAGRAASVPAPIRASAGRRQLQETPMKKTFAAFVAVAMTAGLLAATPASAQRGVAAPDGQGYGRYDYFGSCEWVTQRFWDGYRWRVRRVRVCG